MNLKRKYYHCGDGIIREVLPPHMMFFKKAKYFFNDGLKTHDVQSYFELPKSEREFLGLYIRPQKYWLSPKWDEQIKNNYPIQYFFREWIFSIKNPFFSIVVFVLNKIEEGIFILKRWKNPKRKFWRKVWPRYKLKSISDVMVESNFALVLDFWYDISKEGKLIKKEREQFYTWLADIVEWIENERVLLKKQIQIVKNNKNINFMHSFKIISKLSFKLQEQESKKLKEIISYYNEFRV